MRQPNTVIFERSEKSLNQQVCSVPMMRFLTAFAMTALIRERRINRFVRRLKPGVAHTNAGTSFLTPPRLQHALDFRNCQQRFVQLRA